jgi:hypothetical protein
MWRQRVLLGLLAILAVVAAVVLAARTGSRFRDDFDRADSTSRWRIVGGTAAARAEGGRSALQLSGGSPDRAAVALADRGRVYEVDNLTIQAAVRVASGRGGIAWGIHDAERLQAYRLELDPALGQMTLYERGPEGPEYAIRYYRDSRLSYETWWRLSIASTEDQFIVLTALDDEPLKKIMQDAQDHEHPSRQTFEQGSVGLYAVDGTAWFDEVLIEGTPARAGKRESAK